MINSLKNNIFTRNVTILFSGTMIASILNYLFHFIIARLVSIEVYGEAESLIALINIISVPAMTLIMVGTQYGAMSKAHDDKEKSHDVIRYLNKKIIIFGLPFFLIALFLTPVISKFLNIESNIPLFFIWILSFLSLFQSVNIGILNGWQNFKDASFVGVLGAVIKLFTGIVLVEIGFALNGILASFLLGGIAAYITSHFMLKFIIGNSKNDDTSSTSNFRPIKDYIMSVFIGTLAINILGNVDMIFAKHNLASLEAGSYGALFVASKIIFFATGIIASVLFSMAAQNKHKQISSFYILKIAIFSTLFISLFSTLIYFLFPKIILALLFGNKYFGVASYLGWYAISMSIFSLSSLIIQYLLSVHKLGVSYFILLISIIGSIFILLLGKSIFDILLIITLVQISSLLISIFFLFNLDKKIKDGTIFEYIKSI